LVSLPLGIGNAAVADVGAIVAASAAHTLVAVLRPSLFSLLASLAQQTSLSSLPFRLLLLPSSHRSGQVPPAYAGKHVRSLVLLLLRSCSSGCLVVLCGCLLVWPLSQGSDALRTGGAVTVSWRDAALRSMAGLSFNPLMSLAMRLTRYCTFCPCVSHFVSRFSCALCIFYDDACFLERSILYDLFVFCWELKWCCRS